jgi:hypothetical protein
MAEQATAGEFEAALRAQIADAHARLDQARETKDYEAVTSLGLRLRYLREVAADSGIDLGGVDEAEPGDGAAAGGEG